MLAPEHVALLEKAHEWEARLDRVERKVGLVGSLPEDLFSMPAFPDWSELPEASCTITTIPPQVVECPK